MTAFEEFVAYLRPMLKNPHAIDAQGDMIALCTLNNEMIVLEADKNEARTSLQASYPNTSDAFQTPS